MTQQTKHKQWEVGATFVKDGFWITAINTDDGEAVADVYGSMARSGYSDEGDSHEKARLIAAAPDSHDANIDALHALSQARSVLYTSYGKDGAEHPHRIAAIQLLDDAEEKIRAAIAKATGGE